MQDRNLLVALKKGEESAFKKLYLKYSRTLGYFIYGYLKNKADAEEIVQETFIKVWENKAHLDPNLSIKNYLFKLSKNALLNKLRRKKVEESYKLHWLEDYSQEHNVTEDEVILADYKNIYQELINMLPPQRKLIFIMSREHGLTYREIADQLHISVKTVERQMSQALKFLKERLLAESHMMLLLLWILGSNLTI
ncbi:MAG: RNA polymerase sigma-70 factor [Candidatus Cyclobacteriaceae bacterium M3_2C_046]